MTDDITPADRYFASVLEQRDELVETLRLAKKLIDQSGMQAGEAHQTIDAVLAKYGEA